MQCNIWPDLSGCPSFKNTALIQEPCLHSPYYTFSISHIYLSKKEGTSDFSHDTGTGTEFNLPLQTIIKLENKQCKTLIPEKRETMWTLPSTLETICSSLCSKGISSRTEQYHWIEGAEIRVLEFVGQRSRRGSYAEEDLKKSAWGPLEYLNQAYDKTPQMQPQNYQGVIGSTTPRAQTELGDVLSWKES